MATPRQFLLGLSVLLLTGCAHQFALTTGGTSVQLVEHGQLPDGCRVIADVSIGVPPDASVAATEAELAILMRNKAADMGADHLVIERSERRPGPNGVDSFVGSARAYACHAVAPDGESTTATDTEPASAGDDSATAP
jgi:hypothetical protein